jgi:hypothetical protein
MSGPSACPTSRRSTSRDSSRRRVSSRPSTRSNVPGAWKQRRRSGEAQLVGQWGAALGLYSTATLAAAELGALATSLWRRAPEHHDTYQVALAWLHARACQTSFEVRALLTAGYPGGAYARTRTLHELAVSAAVIAGYGRRPQHADLAERYLHHMDIEQYQQAERYQRSSRELGHQPAKHGCHPAAEKDPRRADSPLRRRLPPAIRVGRRAELPARVVRQARSQSRHALPALLLHHRQPPHPRQRLRPAPDQPPRDGNVLDMLAGPTSAGLAQPAQGALNALVDVTAGLLLHSQPQPGFIDP